MVIIVIFYSKAQEEQSVFPVFIGSRAGSVDSKVGRVSRQRSHATDASWLIHLFARRFVDSCRNSWAHSSTSRLTRLADYSDVRNLVPLNVSNTNEEFIGGRVSSCRSIRAGTFLLEAWMVNSKLLTIADNLNEVSDYRGPRHQAGSNQIGAGDSRTCGSGRKNLKLQSFIRVSIARMLDHALQFFKIKPDFDLDVMRPNQTLNSLTARVLDTVENACHRFEPNMVLVQGDTTTAFASALAAYYCKIAVGHIEAGLRSHDIYNPFPEEANRRLASVLDRNSLCALLRYRGTTCGPRAYPTRKSWSPEIP